VKTLSYTNGRAPILTDRAVHNAMSRWDAARGTGRQIRWARDAARISRVELAQFADMSERTLARIENGERALSGRERAAIARGLGVSLGFLTASARPRSFVTDPAGTTTVRTREAGG
jgi:transcriptional regulator with XRE-family HTH domain